MTINRSVETDPQPGETMPQLMNAQDVAELLGIARKTVHELVRNGRLGCVEIHKRNRLFTEEQVREFVRTKTREVRIDKKTATRLSCPRKGGEKSSGDSRTSLRKEMMQWQ